MATELIRRDRAVLVCIRGGKALGTRRFVPGDLTVAVLIEALKRRGARRTLGECRDAESAGQ
jgi:hypothetical protein